MRLRYSQRFLASLRALGPDQRRTVLHTLEWFVEDPNAPGLFNHPLQGTLTAKRAISADTDLRIIFAERGGYAEVTLLDVGTHAAVYRP